jgi:galactose oxidase
LTKLDGVAAVRPIANTQDSTAEVYLRDQSLPALDSWPDQLASSANASYDFRGVEVTVTGTVVKQNGILRLTGPSFDAPVKLMSLEQGTKLQWDHRARKVKDLTSDERDAYRNLKTRYQDIEDEDGLIQVTGPLTKTDTGWILHVRKFEQ